MNRAGRWRWARRCAVACGALLVLLVGGGATRVHAQYPVSGPPGTCLGGSCVGQRAAIVYAPVATPDGCGIGRGAAITGVVGAALVLGGAVALGLDDDDPQRSRITWGVFTVSTAALTPFVALGGALTRRRCRVKGHPPTRTLGWTGYAGSLPVAAYAWAQAWRGYPPTLPLSIGIGATALFGVLPMAFDSFLSWRQARGPALTVQLGPITSLRVRF